MTDLERARAAIPEGHRWVFECTFTPDQQDFFYESIVAAFAVVRQTERERCATVCETLAFTPQGPTMMAKHQRQLCAKAIRGATP